MTDFMHFLANRAKILYGNLGDYHLSIGIFWVLTKGVAPQGPQNPTKKLTHLVDILGHLLSRNHVSNFFDLGTPPLPKNIYLELQVDHLQLEGNEIGP